MNCCDYRGKHHCSNNEMLKNKLEIFLKFKLNVIILAKQQQLVLKADCFKRRPVGFRHVASDKPQGSLLKGGCNI